MLSDHTAVPVLAVTDLERARQFYEGTLGLSTAGPSEEGLLYRVANGHMLVYQSSYAGTNRATGVAFEMEPDAFDAEVADLRSRGVTFQTFDMPGTTWDDGVASIGPMRAVWFEDPDGNILNVGTSMTASRTS